MPKDIAAEYPCWNGMKGRCRNPKDPSFPRYGGRGIKVCERWDSFENFLQDVGPRPSPAHTLERIDNEAGYHPGNVRWATTKEQANNRRSNVRYTFDGVTQTIKQWAETWGISYHTLLSRHHQGRPLNQPHHARGLRT